MKREQYRQIILLATVLIGVMGAVGSVFAFTVVDNNMTAMLLGVAGSIYAAGSSIYVSRLKQRRLRQRRVFIMYSHADQAIAEEIVEKLKQFGYNPWFDMDEIAPGQRIAETIDNGLAQSAVALLLVSKNLDFDGAIGKELKIALATMKSKDELFSPVIPVRLDETEVPLALANVSWINLCNSDSFEQLDRGLKRVLGIDG